MLVKVTEDSGESLALLGWANSFSWCCISSGFAKGHKVIYFQYKSFVVFIRGCVHPNPDEVPPSSASKDDSAFQISTGDREEVNLRWKCALIL